MKTDDFKLIDFIIANECRISTYPTAEENKSFLHCSIELNFVFIRHGHKC